MPLRGAAICVDPLSARSGAYGGPSGSASAGAGGRRDRLAPGTSGPGPRRPRRPTVRERPEGSEERPPAGKDPHHVGCRNSGAGQGTDPGWLPRGRAQPGPVSREGQRPIPALPVNPSRAVDHRALDDVDRTEFAEDVGDVGFGKAALPADDPRSDQAAPDAARWGPHQRQRHRSLRRGSEQWREENTDHRTGCDEA